LDRREERVRREERGERRERRAYRWVPPSCGVHISKTIPKSTRWPNINGFKSWV